MPIPPRELSFGALFAYSPKGNSARVQQSRRLRHELKRDGFTNTGESMIRWVAERIAELRGRLPFDDFFGADVTLVPMPTHARQRDDSLWVPKRICDELCRAGLASSIAPCIHRTTAVPKAAQSRPEDRPTVAQHHSSMSLDRSLEPLEDVLLVDDVITRGATLMAAAIRISEAFPSARVRAFAVLRTFSDPESFRAVKDPCCGVIHYYESGKTHREP